MSELGYYTLRIALVVAAIGIVTGFFGGARQREDLSALARRALWLCTALVAIASGVLVWALVVGDMSMAYVAKQSARSMPLFYRVSSWWGGQAGSLLLWLLVSLIYASAAVWVQRRKLPTLSPYVCAILLVNGLFFLVLVNFFANPFEKLAPEQVLSDGSGLNPLLQHPLMVIHPVMLYAGFTGFSVPFAFAFAALIRGELSGSWLRATRRLTLVPWFFLSIGILLGGRWAYEVLGWGGYWAWDPVENASFMPWLAATAYLHSVMIQEKRNMLRIWNLVLVGLTYSLCLFGTFLTRSGVISSVHSFAASNFGSLFLIYVLIAIAAYFALLIYHRKDLRSENELESLASREASFVVNNWLKRAMSSNS